MSDLKDTETLRVLAFSLSEQDFAIPLSKVKEVVALSPITPIPQSPAHFKGIMNLRGQVISVVDLRQKLKMSKNEITRETAIVILDVGELNLGVIVDSVESVLALEPGEIVPAPDQTSVPHSSYLTGVAKRQDKLILLLEVERSLSLEDLNLLKKQNNKTAAA